MPHLIQLEQRVVKRIKRYPAKHQKQIKEKILSLGESPFPNDSKELVNCAPYRRCDCGEYRIVYRVDGDIIYIILVGKRNDGEVYQALKRLL